MDEIAKEYDVIVLGTGKFPFGPRIRIRITSFNFCLPAFFLFWWGWEEAASTSRDNLTHVSHRLDRVYSLRVCITSWQLYCVCWELLTKVEEC